MPQLDTSKFQTSEPKLDVSKFRLDTSKFEVEEPDLLLERPEPEGGGGFLDFLQDNPLTSGITDAPSRFMESVSDYLISDEAAQAHPMARFGKQAMSLAGNIGSSISPADLALAGFTGGGSLALTKGLPAIAKVMKWGSRAAAVPVVGRGASIALDPESTLLERGLGIGEAVGGGMLGTGARIPDFPRRGRIVEDINDTNILSSRHVQPSGEPIIAGSGNILDTPDLATRPTVRRSIGQEITGASDEQVQELFENVRGAAPSGPRMNRPPTEEEILEIINTQGPPSRIADEATNVLDTPATTPESIFNPETKAYLLPREKYDPELVTEIRNRGFIPAGVDESGNLKFIKDRRVSSEVQYPDRRKPEVKAADDRRLPRDLRYAKPKHNIGRNSYEPIFEDDLDKALFIIANPRTTSKRHDDYLKFIMDQTGLDSTQAMTEAARVRKQIRSLLTGQPSGKVEIPAIFRSTDKGVQPLGDEFFSGAKLGPDRPASTIGVTTPEAERILSQPLSGGGTPPRVPPTGGGGPPIPPEEIPEEINKISQQVELANPNQKPGLYRQISGTMRNALTTWDFSAPARQGIGAITHPEWWRSWKQMFKAWGSEDASRIINDAITNDPSGLFTPRRFKNGQLKKSFAEEAGLRIGEGEEIFRNRGLAKYLPGADRSQRAYNTYLRKLRADMFKKFAKQELRDGVDITKDLNAARKIADSINVSTGTSRLPGDLDNSETAIKTLNELFFAPRLQVSRLKMYSRILDPRTYANAPKTVRKEAWRSLLGAMGAGLAVQELGRLAGAAVSNDATSSDFRKIKFGNTRIDTMAGLQQYAVAATRFLLGESTSSVSERTTDLTAGRYGQQTREDIIYNLATSKAAPIPSLALAFMRGKEFDGMPFDLKWGIAQRVAPIISQDLMELYQEDPELLPLGILPMIGIGMQTYGR